MKKLLGVACVVAVLGVTAAVAGDKKMEKAPAKGAAAAAADKTCGQMMSEKAVLPAKMAELVTAVATMADAHANFMLTSEPKSKEAAAEAEGMKKLAQMHRDSAVAFTKIAESLKAAAAWPAAPHDMKKMMADPKIQESMKLMLSTHKEMAALLQKEVAMMEQPAPKTN